MKPECLRTLEALDALESPSLAVTDPTLAGHLAGCPLCSGEIEARLSMRNRLKSAVGGMQTPPELRERIRQSIRTGPVERPAPTRRWMAIAAGVAAVGFGITIAYQLGHLRFTHDSQVAFAEQLVRRVSTGMAPAVRDHLHCSHFGRVPKTIPPEAESTRELEPQNREMLEIVRKHIPASLEMYSGHQCRLKGRKFVHFQFKEGSKLLSVIVTKKGVDEAFVRNEAVPALAGGVSLYQAKAMRFELSAFETRDYFTYVVSDLSAERNSSIMVAMAPEVKQFLEKLPS